MARILFIPCGLSESAAIALVWDYLKGDPVYSLKGIALDDRLEALFKKHNLPYQRFSEYKAKNAAAIIHKENPDLVLAHAFSDVTRAFIFAANALGIPTLFVNDGVTTVPPKYGNIWYSPRRLAPKRVIRWLKDKKRFNLFLDPLFTFRTLIAISSLPNALKKMSREMEQRFPRVYPEGLHYAVAGQHAKEAYITMGVPAEKVFVTGQPRFDRLLNQKYQPDKIRTELNIPVGKGLFVLATQPLYQGFWAEAEYCRLVEIIVQAMSEFPQHQLVIKLHPSEDESYYQEILAAMGQQDKVIVCRDVDIYELLNTCDLLLTAHSTVALEAMILDKPVVTVNLSSKPDVMPYARSGAALGVYRSEDLVPAISDSLSNPQVREELTRKRKTFVYEHAYLTDGQASRRVAELFVKLIEGRKRNTGDRLDPIPTARSKAPSSGKQV